MTSKFTKQLFPIDYNRAGLPQPQEAKSQPVRSIGSPLDLSKLVAAAEARARVNALMGF